MSVTVHPKGTKPTRPCPSIESPRDATGLGVLRRTRSSHRGQHVCPLSTRKPKYCCYYAIYCASVQDVERILPEGEIQGPWVRVGLVSMSGQTHGHALAGTGSSCQDQCLKSCLVCGQRRNKSYGFSVSVKQNISFPIRSPFSSPYFWVTVPMLSLYKHKAVFRKKSTASKHQGKKFPVHITSSREKRASAPPKSNFSCEKGRPWGRVLAPLE